MSEKINITIKEGSQPKLEQRGLTIPKQTPPRPNTSAQNSNIKRPNTSKK